MSVKSNSKFVKKRQSYHHQRKMNNGFSSGEEDSRGPTDQVCCLIDDGDSCRNAAGNASYSKRIQKTVTQRRLKLNIDPTVSIILIKIFFFLMYYIINPLPMLKIKKN